MSEFKLPFHVFDVTLESYGDKNPVRKITVRVGVLDVTDVEETALRCVEDLITPKWEGSHDFTVMACQYLDTQEKTPTKITVDGMIEMPSSMISELMAYREWLEYCMMMRRDHPHVEPNDFATWFSTRNKS